jgi:hypothetical protein
MNIIENNKMTELKAGEKYLTISLFYGQVYINCYKNENKKKEKDPSYIGDGACIFVNEKKEKAKEEEI